MRATTRVPLRENEMRVDRVDRSCNARAGLSRPTRNGLPRSTERRHTQVPPYEENPCRCRPTRRIRHLTTSLNLATMAAIAFGIPHRLNIVCQAVILVTTVYSGVEYFVKNRDVFKE